MLVRFCSTWSQGLSEIWIYEKYSGFVDIYINCLSLKWGSTLKISNLRTQNFSRDACCLEEIWEDSLKLLNISAKFISSGTDLVLWKANKKFLMARLKHFAIFKLEYSNLFRNYCCFIWISFRLTNGRLDDPLDYHLEIHMCNLRVQLWIRLP